MDNGKGFFYLHRGGTNFTWVVTNAP
jgi:hypothetical protein